MEVEFFVNGTIEVEKFQSDGRVQGETALDDLFNRFLTRLKPQYNSAEGGGRWYDPTTGAGLVERRIPSGSLVATTIFSATLGIRQPTVLTDRSHC